MYETLNVVFIWMASTTIVAFGVAIAVAIRMAVKFHKRPRPILRQWDHEDHTLAREVSEIMNRLSND